MQPAWTIPNQKQDSDARKLKYALANYPTCFSTQLLTYQSGQEEKRLLVIFNSMDRFMPY